MLACESLAKFVSHSSAERVTVEWCEPVGLLQSKSYPVLGTSVDSMCILAVHRDGETERHVVAVDAKTRTSHRTVSQAQSIRRTYGAWVEVTVEESERFTAVIPEATYRTQVIHHCLVTGAASCLFVVGSCDDYLYAALVGVSREVRREYLARLERAMRFFAMFRQNPLRVPRVVLQGDLG